MSLITHDHTERVDTSYLDLEHWRELLEGEITPRQYAILLLLLAKKGQAYMAEALGISERLCRYEVAAISTVVLALRRERS